MTDLERQLLDELAGRIRRAPVAQPDREADDIIRRDIGSRPDALYILTQTVLLQEMALNQLKQQVDDLKRQPAAQPQQSFLGDAPQQANRPASGFRASNYQTGQTPQPVPPQAPQYAPPQYLPPDPQQSGGRFSGFLRNAAQTAAGVVAGEVAFSALSSLFGHHDNYYGGSGFFGGGSGISPVSETIITNNYYEGDRGGEHEHSRYEDEPRLESASDDSGDYQDVADDDASYDDNSDSTDSTDV